MLPFGAVGGGEGENPTDKPQDFHTLRPLNDFRGSFYFSIQALTRNALCRRSCLMHALSNRCDGKGRVMRYNTILSVGCLLDSSVKRCDFSSEERTTADSGGNERTQSMCTQEACRDYTSGSCLYGVATEQCVHESVPVEPLMRKLIMFFALCSVFAQAELQRSVPDAAKGVFFVYANRTTSAKRRAS